jgi:hypothetical protein
VRAAAAESEAVSLVESAVSRDAELGRHIEQAVHLEMRATWLEVPAARLEAKAACLDL